MKRGILIGGAVLIAVVMFAAGVFTGPAMSRVLGIRTAFYAGPATVIGGPMANLSAEDREKIQNMTDEERRQYFQERMGGQAPGGGRRMGGGLTLEGEIIETASDTITIKTDAGGSQVVYRDDETILAFAKDAEQAELSTGDKVLMVAEPEGDNVLSATAIIVK